MYMAHSSNHRRTHRTDCAVLDLKFSPASEDLFAVAGSVGQIDLFVVDAADSFAITKSRSFTVDEPSILVLSLEWAGKADENRIAASMSNGKVVILSFDSDKDSLCSVQAHDLEAWYVKWDDSNPAILYSGGDDSALCVHACVSGNPQGDKFDLERSDDRVETQITRLSKNSKIHEAGVTAILPLAKNEAGEMIMATGSYDERLRLLRCSTQSGKCQLEAEAEMGGGVWRLSLIGDRPMQIAPGSTFRILASCMHAGPRIVELHLTNEGEWSIRILARFSGHESMNYASGILRDQEPGVKVVSSSFYDQKLCLWRFEER